MDQDKINAFREAEAQKQKEEAAAEAARHNAEAVANTVKTGSLLGSKASTEIKNTVKQSGEQVASEVQKVQATLEAGQDSVAQAINNLMLATVLTKDPRLAEAAENVAKLLSSVADASSKFGSSKLNLLPVANEKLAQTIADLAKSVREKPDQDLSPQFDKVVEALNRLDVTPVVNIPKTDVKLDVTPIVDAVKELRKDLKPQKIDIPKVDFKEVINGLKAVQETIGNLTFPVANYVLPFKNTQGAAVQVQLDSSGNLPVAVISGGGGGTQYADGAARGTATGTLAMVDDGTLIQSMAGDSNGNARMVGSIAHDGVDSGNPIKIGGKVSTTVPTPVAAADRVDAWLDEYGRQVISDSDVELGVTSGTTGLRDRLVAQRHTVLADSLADGIAGFWTQTVANGGTVASTVGEGQLKTSTATNGSAQITSPNVPYYPGQVAWLNSAVRFGDAGTAGDIRRLGMFTVSGTTPQEGFYYELTGTTLNAVTVKAGTPTAVASTSWTRFAVAPFTLDTNYHSLEIRYTANTVWFYVDNVLRHVVSGTSAALTTSLTLPITVTNVKTSGATDITFAVRNIGNGRFGAAGGSVTETGVLALDAHAVGGATPHDSVDSGNPVKVGGQARTTNPTAVADADRSNFITDKLGRQIVVMSHVRDLVVQSVVTLTSSTSETTLLAAGAAGVLHDLTYLKLTNSSATGTLVTIRDATAGTAVDFWYVPAGMSVGGVLQVPFKQTTAANNWTVQCGTSVASVYATVQAVKNL